MRRLTVVLILLLAAALVLAFVALTTPSSSGGSVTYTNVGPVQTTARVLVSQRAWKRKGKIRHISRHVTMTRLKTKSRALSGPCYRVTAEVDGNAKLIHKVVQGIGTGKLCMRAGNHARVLDKYTSDSSSHRETWMWDFQGVDAVHGAGVSTTWCLDPGEQGPCQGVEYRYWRFTFHWLQGVNVFGQTIGLHHKTLFVGCTLRAGNGGYQCGTGEA